MLIKCPECELQVSDKAYACPHCGYPLKSNAKNITRKAVRSKRLPNGFGQISLIRNKNLRNPYRAMVTVGKDSNGKPICKPLKPVTYFKTYNDAYAALMEYNKNPYELDASTTLGEIYEKWYERKVADGMSESTLRTYAITWRCLGELKDKDVRSIKASTIKSYLDKYPAENKKNQIKIMFNQLLDYAMEYELVDRNVARTFSIHGSRPDSKKHTIYSDEELRILWENKDVYGVDLILIQCYTGLRPQEIGLLKLSDFDQEKMIVRGGLKTEDGRNRIIPFHSCLHDLVLGKKEEALKSGSEYLFTIKAKSDCFLSYERFVKLISMLCTEFGLSKHKGHDGRLTFTTLAKRAGVDEYVIKRVLGHRINDLTERVYTVRSEEWLKEEIEKISVGVQL